VAEVADEAEPMGASEDAEAQRYRRDLAERTAPGQLSLDGRVDLAAAAAAVAQVP
jgi:hypothetical protein